MGHEEDWQVVEYIKIARKEMHKPDDWLPTKADVMKSALLRRIRAGLPLFKVPPPRAYSYPWYNIIDSGEYVYNHRVHTPVYFLPSGAVSICQDNRWRRVSDEPTILTYYGDDRWLLEDVPLSDKIDTGGRQLVNDENGPHSEPIYATKRLRLINGREIWHD